MTFETTPRLHLTFVKEGNFKKSGNRNPGQEVGTKVFFYLGGGAAHSCTQSANYYFKDSYKSRNAPTI